MAVSGSRPAACSRVTLVRCTAQGGEEGRDERMQVMSPHRSSSRAPPRLCSTSPTLTMSPPFLQRSTPSWQTGRPINHVPSGRQTTSGMYLLDTNALSELLKKHPKPQFLTRLRRHPPKMFFTSSICMMELRHGSRQREDQAVFWQRITHEVLSRVTILDFSFSEAVVAGDILAHLARRGELIGVEDVLIGATALVREYTVVRGNVRHFERIPALQVGNWLV